MSRAVTRLLIVWLAAVSLLLNGWLPVAAQAAAGPAPAMMICHAAAPASAPKSPHSQGHCAACCGSHFIALPMPPLPQPAYVALLTHHLAPAAGAAQQPGQPLRHAQPRAPPRA